MKKSVLLLTREELGLNPDRSSALLFLSFLPIPPSHLFNIAWPLLKVVNAMSHSLSLNFLSRSCHSPFSQVVRSKDNKKKKKKSVPSLFSTEQNKMKVFLWVWDYPPVGSDEDRNEKKSEYNQWLTWAISLQQCMWKIPTQTGRLCYCC